MKSGATSPNNWFDSEWFREWLRLARLPHMLVLAVILSGCARTITPVIPKDSQASFDGNQENSGFIGWATNGSGIITPHARDRYNSLVFVYGTNFAPALKLDAGLTQTQSNAFLIDPQHLIYFTQMNRWKKEGR